MSSNQPPPTNARAETRFNPWKQSVLEWCRNFVRFGLWIAITVNALMLAIFSIRFTYLFLVHLWSWCDRVLFPGSW